MHTRTARRADPIDSGDARRGLRAGVGCVIRAFALLRRERALWIWAGLPMCVTLATFGVAAWVFFGFALDPITEGVTEALAVADPEAWYQWIWVGPVRVLAWLVRWVVVLSFFVATYLVFTAVGGVLASPFLEELSRRVEHLETGAAPEAPGGLRALLATVGGEAKRVAVLMAGAILFTGLGLLPVVGLLAAPIGALFAAFFLPLEYAGYALDRRAATFEQRRRWLWAERRTSLPFGFAALCTFFVPGLNFLALPVLVTAGTLLAIDLLPNAASRETSSA